MTARAYGSLAGLATVALLLLGAASVARAQVTLLVRDEASATLDAPTGADEAIRATGGSVRRLDASLEDMALAAGCGGEPESPECVAALATAAHADWLAIEHTSPATAGWHVSLELRRGSSGARSRTVAVSCVTRADCVSALTLALRPASAPAPPGVVDVPAAAPSATSVVVVRSARAVVATTDVSAESAARDHAAAAEPAGSMSLTVQILFASAAVVSLGAMIAGGIGLESGRQAWALGTLTRADVAERAASLESSRDWGLGFGTALAITGACLAIAAVVLMVVEHPRWGGLALWLRGAAAPTSAMLSLDGSF